MVRDESAPFFGHGDHVRDRIEALRTQATRVVVLTQKASSFIDITAAEISQTAPPTPDEPGSQDQEPG